MIVDHGAGIDEESARLIALGARLDETGDAQGAMAVLNEALRLSPKSAEAHFLRAQVLSKSDLKASEQALRAALDADPNCAPAAFELGRMMLNLGRSADAALLFHRALAVRPGDAEAWRLLGYANVYLGRFDEARDALQAALDVNPACPATVDLLADLQPTSDGSPEAKRLSALIEHHTARSNALPTVIAAEYKFALAKSHEARGALDDQFAALMQANRLYRSTIQFDIAVAERHMQAIENVFSQDLIEQLAPHGLTNQRAIFIVGMPRSGSTLIEQILNCYPSMGDTRELPLLQEIIDKTRGFDGASYPQWAVNLQPGDCLRIGAQFFDSVQAIGVDQPRFTAKFPLNFLHLGLIRACLPNAKIIHCQRDPRDVAISVFERRFAGDLDFTYDLGEFARYWRAYDRLMAHWRRVLPAGWMLEVPYEEVVGDLETWARRVVTHCGLDWRPECLGFHRATREVRTHSFGQVRQPIYTSSVGRWRKYARHLGPMIEALGPDWAADPPSTLALAAQARS